MKKDYADKSEYPRNKPQAERVEYGHGDCLVCGLEDTPTIDSLCPVCSVGAKFVVIDVEAPE